MNDVTIYTTMDSPIGELTLTGNGVALTGLYMERREDPRPDWLRDDAPFAEAQRQLEAYFAGELTTFDLPLAPRGTPFQEKVWQALRTIPYGKTASYRDVAVQVGNPTAVRAVGAANGRNPISIIVPCHRVIGADGSLTGYGGGMERKRWLLDLESRVVMGSGPVLVEV
jgi:methylated-DNA-[protein]-cysteine S-methyltransferase